jgi:hypothetical protein
VSLAQTQPITRSLGTCAKGWEADGDRLARLEAEVAVLRAEIAAVRRETLGFRWHNSPDGGERAMVYQAGVE